MPQTFKAVVIDDVALCRQLLTDILEDRGYQVKSYASIKEFTCPAGADERCPMEHACVDIFLTDNQMPETTGLEAIADMLGKGCKLRATSRAVFSGSWSHQEKQKAQHLGCKTFDKPFELDSFESWLQEREASLSG
ncbi:MAG: response regulator [Desulfuromonadaceae bacterium]|nr:response regulator [Desulfuromonadaceae bacterium]